MTSQVCRLICIFLNLLSIYNLWVNLSQTWTDYVFGVFFPSLAYIRPRVMDWQQIFKKCKLAYTLMTSSVDNFKC